MELITILELAPRLKTTPGALYTRHSRNPYSLPPVVKIPGDSRIFFNADALDDWLADPVSFMPQELRPKRRPGRPRKHSLTNGGAK